VFVDCRHDEKALAQMTKLLSLNIDFYSELPSKYSEIRVYLMKKTVTTQRKKSGKKFNRFSLVFFLRSQLL
jgi:hypothetical protein